MQILADWKTIFLVYPRKIRYIRIIRDQIVPCVSASRLWDLRQTQWLIGRLGVSVTGGRLFDDSNAFNADRSRANNASSAEIVARRSALRIF